MKAIKLLSLAMLLGLFAFTNAYTQQTPITVASGPSGRVYYILGEGGSNNFTEARTEFCCKLRGYGWDK